MAWYLALNEQKTGISNKAYIEWGRDGSYLRINQK